MTAIYGRVVNSRTTCSFAGATQAVRTKCGSSTSKRTCTLRAYDSEFGGRDVCPGQSEQLRVTYKCKKGNLVMLYYLSAYNILLVCMVLFRNRLLGLQKKI